MPGLNREVILLSVEPGQTVRLEVTIRRDQQRGVTMWDFQRERLLGFWTNQPMGKDPNGNDTQYDNYGGAVTPTIGGAGGAFEYKNTGTEPFRILVNATHIDKISKLKLLLSNPKTGMLEYGGGEDDYYKAIILKVRYIKKEDKQ